MEQETMVKEILTALDFFSTQIRTQIAEMNDKFEAQMKEMNDRLEARIDQLEDEMNERFNRLETKIDSLRIELTETQDTVDFHSAKIAQHERKLRKLYRQL